MKYLAYRSRFRSFLKSAVIAIGASAFLFIALQRPAFGQWTQVTGFSNQITTPNVDNVDEFLVYGNDLLAGAKCGYNLAGATGDSLFLSTDNGQTWTDFAPNGGPPLLSVGTTLIGGADSVPGAGILGEILSYSTTAGQTWKPDTLGWPIANGSAMALLAVGNKIYMASAAGIYQQTAPGMRWTPDTVGMTVTSSGQLFTWPVTMLISAGNAMFASAGFGAGMYVSTNNGASWFAADNGLPSTPSAGWLPAWGYAISGSSVVLAIAHDSTDNTYDFYRTSNSGANWTKMNSAVEYWGNVPPQLAASGQNIFAATDSGFYVSTNDGATWTQWNTGLPTANGTYMNAVQVSGGYVLVSTFESGVWIRKLSDFGISAVTPTLGSPNGLSLALAGNPSSGSTVQAIFTLPDAGLAQVSLMDELGRSIRVLHNGRAAAGQNSISLDTQSLIPGTYFIRVEANGASAMQKLVIAR